MLRNHDSDTSMDGQMDNKMAENYFPNSLGAINSITPNKFQAIP